MNPHIPALLARHPRTTKIAAWAGGIFVFLILFGFLGLPPIVKHFAAKALTEKLHRPVTIRGLAINPLKLSVNVLGLRIGERTGTETFFSIDELHAAIGMQSIREGAPVLREIHITSPYFRVARDQSGHYNIDDILADLLKPSEPVHYSINNIMLDGGKVEFDDQPTKVRHLVSDIHLRVPFISNLPYEADIYVNPDFSAKINGAPVHLSGRTKPFSKNRESSIDLQIKALDLSPYFEYLPFRQKMHLSSAKLDADMEVAFLQAPKKSAEVKVSGKASLTDVALTGAKNEPIVRFAGLSVDLAGADIGNRKLHLRSLTLQQPRLNVPGGDVAVEAGNIRLADATLSWKGAITLAEEELGVEKLNLRAGGQTGPRVDIGALALKHIEFDQGKRTVSLGSLDTSAGKVALTRGRDGAIDLVQAFAQGQTPRGAQAQASNEKPWRFTLAKFTSAGYAVDFTDETPEEPVHVSAESIKIDASDISNQRNQAAKLAVELQLNKSGNLSIAGTAGLDPIAADIRLGVKSARLVPFQPYFTRFLTVLLTDGTLSADGRVRLDALPDGAPRFAFDGDLSLNRLATVDKDEEEDFLKWNTLALRQVSAVSSPLRLDVANVELDRFYSRLTVNPDGTLNLQHVLRPTAQPAGTTPTPPSTAPTATAAPPDYKIAIANVALRNGKVDFSDYFIKPNYSAHLTSLGGNITGLSSDPGQLAQVALKGKVDDQGQLDIGGKINPLSGNLYLDLLASLQDFELSSLAPYSAKYAGYGIQKGKLAFDVKYRIENRKLTAENHLFLNQLTFGEKTDSPDATKLPVLLAVALLKDRNGNIDVNLPISGSLDDPDFSVGGIVVKVIVNLVVKAVTAPFALIGSIFGGGGEELSYINFDHGKSALGTDAQRKLDTIAKALNDRPGLKLDITGQVDPVKDREGLKKLDLAHKVKTQKLKELIRNSNFSGTTDDIELSDAEYARYLAAAYNQEKIPNKPRNFIGFAKTLPVAEMEKLMLANIHVSDGDLRDLANHRAQEAKEYLVDTGKVPAERIFITAPKTGASEEKGVFSRANFTLGAH